jgi:hypothetical protein
MQASVNVATMVATERAMFRLLLKAQPLLMPWSAWTMILDNIFRPWPKVGRGDAPSRMFFCCGRIKASIDFLHGFRLQERQVDGNPDVSS